ncbi:Uncharacterised protein [Vibrio cholerae]|nr:Uncharacterised protein [Vibrio cholerae]
MAERVIDVFEVINVQIEHNQRRLILDALL